MILRRNNIFLYFLLTCLLCTNSDAQDDFNVIHNKWQIHYNAPNALYNHLSDFAFASLLERENEISELSTVYDWQQKQKQIKQTLVDLVGPFPERTPLNAKILNTVIKDDYTIENIVFESQPGYFVTSSLFIPNNHKEKTQTILYCSGHSSDGYRSSTYQHIILNLVKKGFIVFAFDPVGQGERLQYYNQQSGKSDVGGPVAQHSYPGAQLIILGETLAKYAIWDGIRAIDYLHTRKDIDISNIGITGRSGGGTQAALIAAFDNRILAEATECYITNYKRLYQSIGPQDAEQILFNDINNGIDHPDLLIVRAPKPTLILSTTRDFFSIQGARETANEVKKIYDIYNKSHNFYMVEDDSSHASTKKNREAMYAFFQKFLDNPGSSLDLSTEILDNDELCVSPAGQVSTSYDSKTIFDLNKDFAENRLNQLRLSRNNIPKHNLNTLKYAKELSAYVKPKGSIIEPVFTGRFQKDGYVIEKFFIKGEGDYVIPYLLITPDKRNNKALLYLHPKGKLAAIQSSDEVEWFVEKGFVVLIPDLVGTGEVGPGNFKGDSYLNGMSYNLLFASVQVNKSIVGIRASDVIRLVGVLNDKPEVDKIYGLAVEEMAPVILHAAAFDTRISHIAVRNSYVSYYSIAMSRFYNSSFINGIVPACLNYYDLPDLEASLAPRKLLIADMLDGAGNFIESSNNTVINASYKYNNAEDNLIIRYHNEIDNIKTLYSDWVK